VQADNTQLVMGEATRRNPYIARNALSRPEISLAHHVQVSSGYKLAARRSSLIYGRNRLWEVSALARKVRMQSEVTYWRTHA
jgi:hypothetical protein